MSSQILVLPPDTANNGRTLLRVPKHSQTSQDAAKTPKRPPRSPQDPQDDPKSTPKRPHVGTSGTSKNQQKHLFFDDFSRIRPLPFTFCSILIKNGLKISSRSLQERSKMPQDAQRPPTWGQHGPNMGPTWGPRGLLDRSKGGQIALPRGSPAQIALRPPTWTPHGPRMDPKWTQMDPKWIPNGPQNKSPC